MTLVSSFTDFLQQVSFVMTAPTFNSFVTFLTGWVFAGLRPVTLWITLLSLAAASSALAQSAPKGAARRW